MTYEFVKHVADNLRFGSYNKKQITFSCCGVKVIDINSNTYIDIEIHREIHDVYERTSALSKPKLVKAGGGLHIGVSTGEANPRKWMTTNTFEVNTSHPDYQFWDEFKTFIKAAYEDKVYKHNCVIEDAFYV